MSGPVLTVGDLRQSSAGGAMPALSVRTVCACGELIYWNIQLQCWWHVDGWVSCP